jgi:hypothetical protein
MINSYVIYWFMVFCPRSALISYLHSPSIIHVTDYAIQVFIHWQTVHCSSSNYAEKDIRVNLFDVYRMEHGQTEEGEVPQHLYFGASIEEIDNATMSHV